MERRGSFLNEDLDPTVAASRRRVVSNSGNEVCEKAYHRSPKPLSRLYKTSGGKNIVIAVRKEQFDAVSVAERNGTGVHTAERELNAGLMRGRKKPDYLQYYTKREEKITMRNMGVRK